MAKGRNTDLEAMRVAKERLAGLDLFRGIEKDTDGTETVVIYRYLDTVEFRHTGNSKAKNPVDLKVEGGKIFLRKLFGPDAQWEKVGEEWEGAALLQALAIVVDPRKILANLEDIYVGPFGSDQKVIRAFLNVRGLGLPGEMMTFIEKGLQPTAAQRPGNLRPLVEFYTDQDNLPTMMTIGRILPGDEDSFTIEFNYDVKD